MQRYVVLICTLLVLQVMSSMRVSESRRECHHSDRPEFVYAKKCISNLYTSGHSGAADHVEHAYVCE